MFYGSTTLATDLTPDSGKVIILKIALFFIPKANPDHEPLYPKVKKWLLEINEDGVPTREIGLDSKGTPLFSAPNSNNYGFWTDSTVKLSPDQLEPVDSREFELLWNQNSNTAEQGAAANP
jgi:hypothetical protein